MKLPTVFEDRDLQEAFEDVYMRDRAGETLTRSDRKLLSSALERALRFLTVDPLTKLLNEQGIEEELAEAVEHAKNPEYSKRNDTAFIMTDIDNFKAYNEATNYSTGDKAIIHTFAFLKGIFKSTDHIARIHGDEGAILAPRLGAVDTTRYDELERRLRGNGKDGYREAVGVLDKGDMLNLSMGFVMIEPGMTSQEIKEYATNALKHVKYLKKHDGCTDVNVTQWSPYIDYQPMKNWLSDRALNAR